MKNKRRYQEKSLDTKKKQEKIKQEDVKEDEKNDKLFFVELLRFFFTFVSFDQTFFLFTGKQLFFDLFASNKIVGGVLESLRSFFKKKKRLL